MKIQVYLQRTFWKNSAALLRAATTVHTILSFDVLYIMYVMAEDSAGSQGL